MPGDWRLPQLHNAACPHCLEQQRITSRVSWLRRVWVLSPMTVCPTHSVRLVEAGLGRLAHPTWSAFSHRHRQAILPECSMGAATGSVVFEGLQDENESTTAFCGHMANVQAHISANAARNTEALPNSVDGHTAIVVADLIWAFTRADRHYPDRLVYEAFASPAMDNPWHMARRRLSGPAEFSTLPLEERHILLATATVTAVARDLKSRTFQPTGYYDIGGNDLPSCLTDPDRSELVAAWSRRTSNAATSWSRIRVAS